MTAEEQRGTYAPREKRSPPRAQPHDRQAAVGRRLPEEALEISTVELGS